MKTTIIAIAALIMVSCKKETPQPECTCNEVYSTRFTGAIIYWEEVSRTPIDVECWRHNEITSEWETTNGVTASIKYHKKQILCD